MIKCKNCGQFVSYESVERGETTYYFEYYYLLEKDNLNKGRLRYNCKKCRDSMIKILNESK